MPQSCDPFTISMAKTIEIIFHTALILSRPQLNLLHVMLSLAFFNKQCNAFHHNVCCLQLLRCKRSMSVFPSLTARFSHRPVSTRRDREPGSYPPNDEDGRAGHAAWKRPGVEEDVPAARGSHRDQHPARPAVEAQT